MAVHNAEAAGSGWASRVKVLERDTEAGIVRLRVDSLDDLWHLRELVEPGDAATALTWRTADVQTVDRVGKAEKRAVTLTVRVEQVEWDAFSNRVRLLGPIVAGAQDVGSYHTIAIEPGMSGRINVRIGVQEDTPVTKSTYAQLGYQGVTGLAYVSLNDDGSSSELLKAAGD